jgi:hypothetical protein
MTLLLLSCEALFFRTLADLTLKVLFLLPFLCESLSFFLLPLVFGPLSFFYDCFLFIFDFDSLFPGCPELCSMQRNYAAINRELFRCTPLPVGLLHKVNMHQPHLLDQRSFTRVWNRLWQLSNHSATDFSIDLQYVLHQLVSLLQQILLALAGFTLQKEHKLVMAEVHRLVNRVLENVLVLGEVLVLILEVFLFLLLVLLVGHLGHLSQLLLLTRVLLLRTELLLLDAHLL